MEEKLVQTNAELDTLDKAEADLATQAHANADAALASLANIAALQAKLLEIVQAAGSGSAIQQSTVTALNARITGEITNAQTTTAALKAALPAPQPAPNITSSLTASGQVGVPFNYEITTDTAALSFGAAGLPDGLVVDTDLGGIEGTPTTAGTSTVSLTAVGIGGTGNASLVITIAEAAGNPPTTGGTTSPADTTGATVPVAGGATSSS